MAGRVRHLCGVRDTVCGAELYEVVIGSSDKLVSMNKNIMRSLEHMS